MVTVVPMYVFCFAAIVCHMMTAVSSLCHNDRASQQPTRDDAVVVEDVSSPCRCPDKT